MTLLLKVFACFCYGSSELYAKVIKMSKRVKRFVIRSFIAIEIIIFTWIYCFGARGLQVVLHLYNRNQIIAANCSAYEQKIKALEHELRDWQQHKDFYYEKYAREKLHMAHADDQIIFINN